MPNVDTVMCLYEAFGKKDRARLLELLHPEVVWVQNKGFPNGGEHIGARVVLDEVFAVFRRQWVSWSAVVREYLDAGESVVALGEYRGTYKDTGRPMVAAFAHVYWVRDGRVVRFEQYTDTAAVCEAIEGGRP